MGDSLKDKFRFEAKLKLRKQMQISARSRSNSVTNRVEKLIKFTKAKRVLIFVPLPYEPNLMTLRSKFGKNMTFYAPFMVGISFKMVKLRLPLKRARFGVKEPPGSVGFTKRLDLAVVPVLGVDGLMARIGHGKGFYDIFFSMLSHKPTTVFVGIRDMFCAKTLSQDHDIKGDFYITPNKNYILRGKNDRDFNRLRCRIGGSWYRIPCSKKNK